MYHSCWIAALHSLLHLIPLGGAITLLILQWSDYWIGTKTNITTLLQFAAKLHELTMQASLLDLLLCIIRTEAVNAYVPLGALSGAAQSTQLSYLWSLDFISIFTSPVLRGWRKAALLIIIATVLILTSLVGPSSAILMIPRPDTAHIVKEATLYALNSTNSLYPSSLSQANGLNIWVP
jgi:hypothetical protein